MQTKLKLVYFQEGKQRKPVERRESSRLQSAAKLLRSLSKTKDVAKSSVESPSKASKEQQDDRPELPDRNHPAYLSEGKGSRKRKNSGKENKEGKPGKDRSHSFHGKLDKKERKYVALERKVSEDNKKYKDDNQDNPSQCLRGEETVVQGARSILLTEDNLIPIKERVSTTARTATSPDLIQDLPRSGALVTSLLNAASGARTSEDTNDDDDYVEADSVALDAAEQEDNDICPSGHGGAMVHQEVRTMSPTDLDSVMETGSADNGVRSSDTR